MAETYMYEKFDENYEIISCPIDDKDGKVTGKIVLNVPKYFDENPEIRKALGWIKHIVPDQDKLEYNRQTQFVIVTVKQLDEYTITDEYRILDKSEEQLAFEEMLSVATNNEFSTGGFHFTF